MRFLAGMAELADAADSKSAEVHPSWGFNSPSRHQLSILCRFAPNRRRLFFLFSAILRLGQAARRVVGLAADSLLLSRSFQTADDGPSSSNAILRL
jgi:hypothetical protein